MKESLPAGRTRDYLPYAPPSCQWRFVVLTVYDERQACQPQTERSQNACSVALKTAFLLKGFNLCLS